MPIERDYTINYTWGKIIDREKPEFSNNNLIMAPVGSGKSFLIEKDSFLKITKGKHFI